MSWEGELPVDMCEAGIKLEKRARGKKNVSDEQKLRKAEKNRRKKLQRRVRYLQERRQSHIQKLPELNHILNPSTVANPISSAPSFLGNAFSAAKNVGQRLVSPFLYFMKDKKILELEKQLEEMQAQIQNLNSKLTTASSAPASNVPDAPPLGNIPPPPPLGNIPPPPPLSNIPVPPPCAGTMGSKPKIPAGAFSMLDISNVKLRTATHSKDKKIPKNAPGALITQEQLAQVSLRRAPRVDTTPVQKQADGIDFGEMLNLKLKKVSVPRSPGGTPLKQHRSAVVDVNHTHEFLLDSLQKKFGNRSFRTSARMSRTIDIDENDSYNKENQSFENEDTEEGTPPKKSRKDSFASPADSLQSPYKPITAGI